MGVKFRVVCGASIGSGDNPVRGNMMKRKPDAITTVDTSRRRFVQGLTASGMLASLGMLSPALLRAAPNPDVPFLDGPVFDLTIDEVVVNFTGRPHTATAINGSIPAPTL
ncbi:MAG: hypothetical protein DSZ33_06305, partial [Gammaproteobacteria bacterium]